jgi:hypothetical protein
VNTSGRGNCAMRAANSAGAQILDSKAGGECTPQV